LKRLRPARALGLALLLAAAASAQEPSTRNPLSRPLPDWLELRAEWRLRQEGRRGELLRPDRDDDFGLSRFRVGLQGEPSEHVRFYVEGQDSRIGWREPNRIATSTGNSIDLRQAWVELGAESEGPVRLRLGRQEVVLGAQRLFGRRDWNNLSPTWDAARLILQRGPDRVDVFSMAITDPGPGFDRPFPAAGDGNVHGAYASLGSLIPNASLEPYLFYVSRPRVGQEHDFGPDSGAWSGGVRLAGGLQRGWRYEAEWTEQRGRARQTLLRGAMGAAKISYGARDWPWQTRIHAEHEYASGDPDPNDGRISTYDSLFAARRRHLGALNIVGRRNIRAWETGVETRPSPSLLVRLDVHRFWLASRRDALYRPNGTAVVAAPADGAAAGRAGDELDFILLWTPAPYWELEAGAMRFFSGEFVREARDEPIDSALLFVAITLRL
jgi:hypothetical protein